MKKQSILVVLLVVPVAAMVALLFRVGFLYFYEEKLTQGNAFQVIGKFHPVHVSDDGFDVDIIVDCERVANQHIYIHLDPPLPYTGFSGGGMIGVVQVNDKPRSVTKNIDLSEESIQFGDPYIYQKELYRLPAAGFSSCEMYEAKISASKLNFSPKRHAVVIIVGMPSY